MANRHTAPVPSTGDALRDIGGAIVRRRFHFMGKELTNGMVLSAGEVLLMNPNNRHALQDNGFIQIFPKPVRSHLEANPETTAIKRHVVSIGFGRWDVIEGKKINTDPLTKEQALALAEPPTQEPPKVTAAPKAVEPVPEVVMSTDEATALLPPPLSLSLAT